MSSAHHTPFFLVLMLWAGAGLGAAAQYGKISVIFHQLPLVYPDAGSSIGFVVSLVGLVGIVFGVVAGLIVARIRYRRALLWALWAGALVSFIQAFLPPLSVMLLTRAVEGLSHLAIVVAAPTLIAQLSAPRHRGFTLTLWATFFGVAYALLVLLGLPLVDWLGLSALFVAHGLWMAASALILGATLRPLEDAVQPAPISLPGILRDHLTIYRSPYLAAPALGWLFYTFCFLSTLTILPPFLPEDSRALLLAAMPLVSIAVSLTLGVYALRRFTAVQVVQAGFVMVILSLLWLLITPGGPLACLAWAASVGLVQGATFAAVPQMAEDAADQAKANGALAQMGNLGNTLGTPLLVIVIGFGGYPAMIWTTIILFAMGFASNLWMGLRRQIRPARAS